MTNRKQLANSMPTKPIISFEERILNRLDAISVKLSSLQITAERNGQNILRLANLLQVHHQQITKFSCTTSSTVNKSSSRISSAPGLSSASIRSASKLCSASSTAAPLSSAVKQHVPDLYDSMSYSPFSNGRPPTTNGPLSHGTSSHPHYPSHADPKSKANAAQGSSHLPSQHDSLQRGILSQVSASHGPSLQGLSQHGPSLRDPPVRNHLVPSSLRRAPFLRDLTVKGPLHNSVSSDRPSLHDPIPQVPKDSSSHVHGQVSHGPVRDPSMSTSTAVKSAPIASSPVSFPVGITHSTPTKAAVNSTDNPPIAFSDLPVIPILENNLANHGDVPDVQQKENEVVQPPTKRTRKRCPCRSYIYHELGMAFTLEELASKRAKRIGNKEALSPNRLRSVLRKAKIKYREKYEEIKDINEVVNRKCQTAQHKLLKTINDIQQVM